MWLTSSVTANQAVYPSAYNVEPLHMVSHEIATSPQHSSAIKIQNDVALNLLAPFPIPQSNTQQHGLDHLYQIPSYITRMSAPIQQFNSQLLVPSTSLSIRTNANKNELNNAVFLTPNSRNRYDVAHDSNVVGYPYPFPMAQISLRPGSLSFPLTILNLFEKEKQQKSTYFPPLSNSPTIAKSSSGNKSLPSNNRKEKGTKSNDVLRISKKKRRKNNSSLNGTERSNSNSPSLTDFIKQKVSDQRSNDITIDKALSSSILDDIKVNEEKKFSSINIEKKYEPIQGFVKKRTACELCTERKIKCMKISDETCELCSRRGLNCVFTYQRKRGRPLSIRHEENIDDQEEVVEEEIS